MHNKSHGKGNWVIWCPETTRHQRRKGPVWIKKLVQLGHEVWAETLWYWLKKYAQPKSWELSFIGGKMRTLACGAHFRYL